MEKALAWAEALADETNLRTRGPRHQKKPMPARKRDARLPMVGTVISKTYRGQTIQIEVLEEGFLYQGETYKSLTAVASKATGSHWNGYTFFGLQLKGGKK